MTVSTMTAVAVTAAPMGWPEAIFSSVLAVVIPLSIVALVKVIKD